MQPCFYCRGGTPGGNRWILYSDDGDYLGWMCDQCANTPEHERPSPKTNTLDAILYGLGVSWLTIQGWLPLRRRNIAKTRRLMGRSLSHYSERSFASAACAKAGGIIYFAALFPVVYLWVLFMAFIWLPVEDRLWPHAADRRYPT